MLQDAKAVSREGPFLRHLGREVLHRDDARALADGVVTTVLTAAEAWPAGT